MYKIVLDDRTKEDIKALRKEKKAVLEAFEEKLRQLEKQPKCHKTLTGQLAGFRKAKFKSNFRIVYSTNDKAKSVLIIAVGHRETIYDIVMKRLQG